MNRRRAFANGLVRPSPLSACGFNPPCFATSFNRTSIATGRPEALPFLSFATLLTNCTPGSGTFPLGTTAVSCNATDASGNSNSCGTSVTVVDTTKPMVSCVQSVNPSGMNVPKASNTNQDGFYRVSAGDNCGGATTIKIGTNTVANGETIKITQTPGKSGVRLVNTMGPLAIKHCQVGPGDAVITATDGSGNTSDSAEKPNECFD